MVKTKKTFINDPSNCDCEEKRFSASYYYVYYQRSFVFSFTHGHEELYTCRASTKYLEGTTAW